MERAQRQTVLVVDDAQDMHDIIEARLRPEDLALLHAYDARTALELAQRRRPDLILLDLDLPDQSGLAVCRQVVEDPELMSIPVIILTGTTAIEAKVEAFDAGAADYITKPFDPNELRARVRAAIRVKQQARERQRLAHLGKMAAVMAHELRNPLASAKGNAQLLEEMVTPGTPVAHHAGLVVRGLARLEALTDNLLEFVRSGRVRRVPCQPLLLAREAAERMGAGVPVDVVDEGAPPTFLLDPHAMERVLTNLLRNAAEAQGSAQPLQLTVGTQGDLLTMSVRDHGPGVPAGVELFAPFVTTKRSGTGLGLAVSRQMVTAHGGHLSLRNHPDGGALAELAIPPPG